MIDQQQAVFTALADPTRRNVLLNLASSSPKTATQLAAEYPLTRQGLLKHLALLVAAGLVVATQHGREKRYTLTPQPLDSIERWIDTTRATWDERLARLKATLESDQSDQGD